MNASPLSTYQELEIGSMSPAERVIFVYSHLLTKLERARTAGDPGSYQEALSQAQEAVSELLVSLNRDADAPMADSLASIYGFFLRELLELSSQANEKRLARLVGMIQSLLETWRSVATTTMIPEAVQ